MRTLTTLAAAIAMAWAAAVARAESGADHVTVAVLADTSAVRAGEPFDVAVRLHVDAGWHVYWTNPGDSGLPTRIKLSLPDGFTAGAVRYPTPAVIRQPGNETMYGYDGDPVFLVPVTPPAKLDGVRSVAVTARVTYLVCSDKCLPGKGAAEVDLPVSASASPSNAEVFAKAAALMPVEADPAHVKAVNARATAAAGGAIACGVDVTWTRPPTDVEFVPDVVAGWDVGTATVRSDDAGSHVRITLAPQAADAKRPPTTNGILIYTADGQRIGVICAVTFPPPAAASR